MLSWGGGVAWENLVSDSLAGLSCVLFAEYVTFFCSSLLLLCVLIYEKIVCLRAWIWFMWACLRASEKKRRRIEAEILAGKRARVKTKRAVHDDKYKNIFILDVSYASAAVTTLLIVKNKSHWRHKICMNGIMNNNNRIYTQTHSRTHTHTHILWLHMCNSMYTTCEIQDFSQVWFSYGRVAGPKKNTTWHSLNTAWFASVWLGWVCFHHLQ